MRKHTRTLTATGGGAKETVVSTRQIDKATKHRSQAGTGDRRRRQQEALRAKAEAEAQARRRRWVWWAGGASAVVLVALIVGLSVSGGSSTPHGAIPGIAATTGPGQPTLGITLSTTPPPWPIPSNAAPYIGAAGLSVRGSETLQVHYHAHVDIIYNGAAVTVPAYIGYLIDNSQARGITSLHTHHASGTVHIESPTDTPFTLGQVFTEWGVRLTTGQVGGLATTRGDVVRVYVNGAAFTGDPATIVLRPHQEIAFWYGSASVTPQVPSSYAFPSGD